MKFVGPTIAAVLLASTVAGCATYTRTEAYRSDAGYYTPVATATVYTPAPTYYTYTTTPTYAYTSDGGYYANGVYHPPARAWNYGTSGDNYYASRGDYYRNYQGIHGGPERTDGP
jgi:hypothetical protein